MRLSYAAAAVGPFQGTTSDAIRPRFGHASDSLTGHRPAPRFYAQGKTSYQGWSLAISFLSPSYGPLAAISDTRAAPARKAARCLRGARRLVTGAEARGWTEEKSPYQARRPPLSFTEPRRQGFRPVVSHDIRYTRGVTLTGASLCGTVHGDAFRYGRVAVVLIGCAAHPLPLISSTTYEGCADISHGTYTNGMLLHLEGRR